jgi:hypothetical protein
MALVDAHCDAEKTVCHLKLSAKNMPSTLLVSHLNPGCSAEYIGHLTLVPKG